MLLRVPAGLQVRCSGLTLATMLPMLLLGATAPLMATGLISSTGSPASPALIVIASALVTGAVVSWQEVSALRAGRYAALCD
jgi:hypothetical protein